MAKNLENYYISREPNDMEQQPPKADMEKKGRRMMMWGEYRLKGEGRQLEQVYGMFLWRLIQILREETQVDFVFPAIT